MTGGTKFAWCVWPWLSRARRSPLAAAARSLGCLKPGLMALCSGGVAPFRRPRFLPFMGVTSSTGETRAVGTGDGGDGDGDIGDADGDGGDADRDGGATTVHRDADS